MANNNNKKDNTNYWPLIMLSIVVVVLYVSSWLLIKNFIQDSAEQGQFGDQFGAINALFSGLAFAGLIFTIILQKKELSLQREELTETRKELNGQKHQMMQHNKTLRIQRFENTFFHMMELQQQIVNDLYAKEIENKTVQDVSSSGVKYRGEVVEHDFQGRNLFSHKFAYSIHEAYDSNDCKVKVYGMGGVIAVSGFSQYELYNTPTLFDHYFRHLYTILKFIDKQDIPEEDKRIFSDEDLYGYAKILRATLSRYELVWLYYNGLSKYGRNKLKPLIEKYCMLKNLRDDLLECCKENKEELSKIDMTPEQVRAEGYSGKDYEFFLTTEYNDKNKYHISAFYKSCKDLKDAAKLVENWNNYLKGKKKHAEALAERLANKDVSSEDIVETQS